MKQTFLFAFLLACGGTDSATIPDGSTDTGSGNDASTGNDGTTSNDGTTGNDGTTSDGPISLDTGTPFNPANVSGLVLWLEADVGASVVQTNQRITQWKDQTSHHNDANGTLNSSVQGRNPTVKKGQINSLDAVHFDKGQINTSGNILAVTDNTDKSLQWGTGDFFVAIVGEFDNDPKDSSGQNFGAGTFFVKTVAVNTTVTGVALYGNIPTLQNIPALGMVFVTSNASANDFAYTGTGYNTNKPHVFAMRRQGNVMDLYVDGASVANATATTNIDVSNATTAIRIGADGDANLLRLDGDIGEIYAVEGALSSSDQTSIQAYLKKKWGTP